MVQQRIVLLSVAGLASALVLAACGSSTDVASSSTSPTGAAPVATTASESATPETPATSAPAGSGDSATTTVLRAAVVNGVGSVVTDGNGMTLYRYDNDQASPSKWTCSGACTKTWVPVIEDNSPQTVGVSQSLLGTVHRNGLKQVTLAGWPLYRYAGDTKAGEANGQAKDGMWHAVTPSGEKSTATG